MLQLHVSVDGRKLRAAPRLKPNMGPTLCRSSAHAPHVHSSWPVAMMQSIRTLCTDPRYIRPAQLDFVGRFKDSFAPDWVVNRLEESVRSPHRAPRRETSRVMPRCKPNEPHPWWCVLGFHLAWRFARFLGVFRRFTQEPMWNRCLVVSLGCQPMQIRMSWGNNVPNLCARTRRSEGVGGGQSLLS